MLEQTRVSQPIVAVLTLDGMPLNPTHPAKARKLLKAKQAKVERRYPVFTIRLTYWPKSPEALEVQPTTLNLDDGETAGVAVVQQNARQTRVVWAGEIHTTGRDVSDRLVERRVLRHFRKRLGRQKRGVKGSPKGEYRWGEDWLPPTIELDAQQKVRVARRLGRIFPIGEIVVETVSVDIRKVLEPDVAGVEYQAPRTLKAFVKWAIPNTCAVCGEPLGEGEAITHHVVKRSKDGARNFTNELPLCLRCHRLAGDEELCLDTRDYRDTRAFGRLQAGRDLLLAELNKLAPVREVKGFATARTRAALGLSKTHIHDAVAAGLDPAHPLPVAWPKVVWEIHNPTRRSRKLFDEQMGVAKYRKAAEQEPGVNAERMRVDDHDHAHNKCNRSYRRHVRSRYYRKLRREGTFNSALMGPAGKEVYSPNVAVHVLKTGKMVVQKRRLFGEVRPLDIDSSFRRNQVVQTVEGWWGKVWALKSSGALKVLFADTHGLKQAYTDRKPNTLAVISRRWCWLPKSAEPGHAD